MPPLLITGYWTCSAFEKVLRFYSYFLGETWISDSRRPKAVLSFGCDT